VSHRLILFLTALLFFGLVGAGPAAEASGGSKRQEIELRWNRQLLENLGLRVDTVEHDLGATDAGFDRFALRGESTLRGIRRGSSLAGLESATLYVDGGYKLEVQSTPILLVNFSLSWNASLQVFDMVTSNGEIPFYADKIMAEPGAGEAIDIRAMDIRISAQLAQRLNRAEVGGWQVASARVLTRTGAIEAKQSEVCPSSSKWPGMPVAGHPGQTYRADVFMRDFTIQMTGCRQCSGPGGNGQIKVTPATILRNNVNNGPPSFTVPGDPRGISSASYSADIPWREMFSADCPPYNNDQHPYLTWNLYRITSEGLLEQIGHSGVKHAHIAANGDCLDNPGSNHVLGRGCSDAYGTGDNDVPEMLGPRSEIIPHTGQWARCGSIYDPQCQGRRIGFRGYDDFAYRLTIQESLLGHAGLNDTYFLEAWYVVRDDVDPYNSMAHAKIHFDWLPTNHLWTVRLDGKVALGPVIDEWANDDRAAKSREISTPDGRIRIALKAIPADRSAYRYECILMNVDYAKARTTGREPNLSLMSSHGVSHFSLAVDRKARLTNTSSIESDAKENWISAVAPGLISWTAPRGRDLRWGNLMRLSFTSDRLLSGVVATWIDADGRGHSVQLTD